MGNMVEEVLNLRLSDELVRWIRDKPNRTELAEIISSLEIKYDFFTDLKQAISRSVPSTDPGLRNRYLALAVISHAQACHWRGVAKLYAQILSELGFDKAHTPKNLTDFARLFSEKRTLEQLPGRRVSRSAQNKWEQWKLRLDELLQNSRTDVPPPHESFPEGDPDPYYSWRSDEHQPVELQKALGYGRTQFHKITRKMYPNEKARGRRYGFDAAMRLLDYRLTSRNTKRRRNAATRIWEATLWEIGEKSAALNDVLLKAGAKPSAKVRIFRSIADMERE